MRKRGWRRRACIAAGLGGIALIVGSDYLAGQTAASERQAIGERLIKGAVDLHFHTDSPMPGRPPAYSADIATIRSAKARGVRALVLKNHNEPTATLAYLLRKEIPGLGLYGGIVMNRTNGGMNPAAVEYMINQVDGGTGKIVWMPAGDSEIESRTSRTPNKPFVAVSRNGELLPETKEVIGLIAKNNLVLASGHIAPEDALLVFAEGKKQGVQHMIATHAMDLAGKMTLDQMQAAVKLGAAIEFDFRNILSEEGRRADAIRKLGPEHCFISEFWTHTQQPLIYGEPDGVGAFAEAMHKRGFTDRELEMMFKDNPARLLGL